MMQTKLSAVLFLTLLIEVLLQEPVTIPGVVLERNTENSCPSNEQLQMGRQTLSAAITAIISNFILIPECGDGLWRQVVSLNMSNSSQDCPSGWMEVTRQNIRTCGRPTSAAGCNQVSFPVDASYTEVCGRVIGRVLGHSADGFATFGPRNDENYVDGVGISYSTPREHIWTFAADHDNHFRCPCSASNPINPPAFVGDNYFCDSEDADRMKVTLWDGTNCGTQSCCSHNSPPWFSVQLPAATSDNIDARICTDEPTENENVLIELMELFVQ